VACIQIPGVGGYCSGVGANPGFSSYPNVQQVSMTSVLVSWHNLVTRIDCADQFIVKSWMYSSPSDYKISDLLPTSMFSYVVEDLMPGIEYVFQVVAREDKGVMGKDWNKSPRARFATSRNAPTVQPGTHLQTLLRPSIKNIQRELGVTESAPETGQSTTVPSPALGQPPEQQGDEKPYGVFIIIFLSSAIIIVIILVTGGIYNLAKLNRRKRRDLYDSDRSSSDDSLELNVANDNLVSWRQSRKDLLDSTKTLTTPKQAKTYYDSSTIDLTSSGAARPPLHRSGSRGSSRMALRTMTRRGGSPLAMQRTTRATQTPQCNCTKTPAAERRRLFADSSSNNSTSLAIGGSGIGSDEASFEHNNHHRRQKLVHSVGVGLDDVDLSSSGNMDMILSNSSRLDCSNCTQDALPSSSCDADNSSQMEMRRAGNGEASGAGADGNSSVVYSPISELETISDHSEIVDSPSTED